MGKQQIIDSILENMNWVELHKEIALSDSCSQLIAIYSDGTFVNLGSNAYLRNDSKAVAVLRTWGVGNLGYNYYTDNWTTENEDGTYTTDDGRILELNDVISECIEDGDHTEQISMWIDEISKQIENNN